MDRLKLTEDQKKLLLKVARMTIAGQVLKKNAEKIPELTDPVFDENFGLFVTLTLEGNLRGCIGYIEGIKPLREAVSHMAIQAAFHDPRFYPLTVEEYHNIRIEVSILYPVQEVKDINEIQVGRDGLIMERGWQKGLLLPQVATEYHWDRETFLNQTCRKAGMETFCWENGAKLSRFEAEVFNEVDLGIFKD